MHSCYYYFNFVFYIPFLHVLHDLLLKSWSWYFLSLLQLFCWFRRVVFGESETPDWRKSGGGVSSPSRRTRSSGPCPDPCCPRSASAPSKTICKKLEWWYRFFLLPFIDARIVQSSWCWGRGPSNMLKRFLHFNQCFIFPYRLSILSKVSSSLTLMMLRYDWTLEIGYFVQVIKEKSITTVVVNQQHWNADLFKELEREMRETGALEVAWTRITSWCGFKEQSASS